MFPFLRHLEHCNNTVLPGGRLPLLLRGATIGWVAETELPKLHGRDGVRIADGSVAVGDAEALAQLGRALAADGEYRFRNEAFDVRADPDGPVLGTLDRGALPFFGISAAGVHLNGLVETGDGPALWVGRRAANKLLDPDKLDHLAAGGVPAGYGAADTLEKEAEEECGLPPAMTRRAVPVGIVSYVMARPEGLRRDRLHCFDLLLPADFQPVPHDGEVAEFFLVPLEEALRLVRDTDAFKFNVNLVLIDLFLRRGLIDPDGAEGRDLRRRLNGGAAAAGTVQPGGPAG
ncbi:MAG: NUDIX domain-containing protein [Gluconacetobacter diazotrophicus]|nr:NUDIX domain-containing protein [Gluconacetobacter diazotrophicus]